MSAGGGYGKPQQKSLQQLQRLVRLVLVFSINIIFSFSFSSSFSIRVIFYIVTELCMKWPYYFLGGFRLLKFPLNFQVVLKTAVSCWSSSCWEWQLRTGIFTFKETRWELCKVWWAEAFRRSAHTWVVKFFFFFYSFFQNCRRSEDKRN